MLFNTLHFLLFYSAFFLFFHFATKSRTQKLWAILVGSLFFYGFWDYRFVPLLFMTALVDFFIAKSIDRDGQSQRRRKLLLVTSVVLNLGVLCFFKYYNFFISSSQSILSHWGLVVPLHTLHIILPIGISFYTFQSMSYTIDVYRKELKARTWPIEFLAGVSFFPHLVAGPIIRASVLLPQFESFRPASWRMVKRGFILVAVGLFKKSVADLLSGQVEALFSGAGPHSVLESWIGSLAFTGQIYGDFSGYTDIAIGVALLLGFTLPPNFNLPYIATSPIDFWRRWHISLSTWLRDYLYIPLGGNRRHRYFNLLATMLLGGLWHGANWTFVVWGFYHGALLVVNHVLGNWWPQLAKQRAFQIPKIAVTFYLVVLGWVLFRADRLDGGWSTIKSLHHSSVSSVWSYEATVSLVLVIAAIIVTHLVSVLGAHRDRSPRFEALLWPIAVCLLAFSIAMGGRTNAFIYFQF